VQNVNTTKSDGFYHFLLCQEYKMFLVDISYLGRVHHYLHARFLLNIFRNLISKKKVRLIVARALMRISALACILPWTPLTAPTTARLGT
jgi:hypothetical protein